MKTIGFEKYLNESKIADAINDQIEDWYDGDASAKKKAEKKISQLTELDPKEIGKRLAKVEIDDAMEVLMEKLDESGIADAIQDQIDYYYDGDKSDKLKACKEISKFTELAPKEIDKRLKKSNADDAMEALMEGLSESKKSVTFDTKFIIGLIDYIKQLEEDAGGRDQSWVGVLRNEIK